MPTPNINKQLLAHILIGVPGSGKSTLATQIYKLGNYEIISTDEIREQIYGDAAVQGVWQEVESHVIQGIYDALKAGKGIIYDATNFKRAFRLDFLQKVNEKIKQEESNFNLAWLGWHLDTPYETCILWNQQRERQVPKEIIKSMHDALQSFPPVSGEGFAIVSTIDVSSPKYSIGKVESSIKKLSRSIINSQNRNANLTLHSYSNLLDFERLMHLISLITKYPGIGNLYSTNPDLLTKIFNNVPVFTNEIQEIAAVMAQLKGAVYACEDALSSDLEWLYDQKIITKDGKSDVRSNSQTSLNKNDNHSKIITTGIHPYSDKEVFERLIGTIRFILDYPFLTDFGGGSLLTLAEALEQAKVIHSVESGLATLRKDIEKVLKPYKILPEFPMRNGYFAGTGILSQAELIKVFDLLRSHAKSLDDPLALDFYNTFKQRLLNSKFIESDDNLYPVRAIANRSKIDPRHLSPETLSNKLPQLEVAIEQCKLLELNRLPGVGRYPEDETSFFLAYPLQIVFSNFAWYLGFECVGGDEHGLLRFERLDRLFLGQPQSQCRRRQEQERALLKLQTLLNASAGVFLGYSAKEQSMFLSSDNKVRLQVCVEVELWFDDKIYPFIAEATKRFLEIKMSPPIERKGKKFNLDKTVFSLPPTKDKQFPHRFKVTLPRWSMREFDFWRWILGFGGAVKVISPEELVKEIKRIGDEISNLYLTF